MDLLVNSITPLDTAINIAIDSRIVIDLNQEVDPFTIANGIALYTPTDSQWIGSGMGILDTNMREVLDVGEEYSYMKYNYTISGTTITITPALSLIPERKFYISIFPGNDYARYISKPTFSTPVITPFDVAPTDTIEVTSSYMGSIADTYKLTVVDVNGSTMDISYYLESEGIGSAITNSIDVTGTFPAEFDMGYLVVSFSGVGFTVGDSIDIDVFPAEGVKNLYRVSFTTSEYNEALPEQASSRIDTLSASRAAETALVMVSTIPTNLSTNNRKVNPITLKFSRDIGVEQNINDIITIKRKSFSSDQEERLTFYYTINGSTIKLFMTGVE